MLDLIILITQIMEKGDATGNRMRPAWIVGGDALI